VSRNSHTIVVSRHFAQVKCGGMPNMFCRGRDVRDERGLREVHAAGVLGSESVA